MIVVDFTFCKTQKTYSGILGILLALISNCSYRLGANKQAGRAANLSSRFTIDFKFRFSGMSISIVSVKFTTLQK